MIWLAVAAAVLAVCFGGVLLFGAPYLPTLDPQVEAALELAGLQPGQTLIDLGCGDGRVLAAAARQGINAVGYELNPLLAAVAWLRTRHHRGRVKIVWGDFWRADWPPADVIFTFLLSRYMAKLDRSIGRYQKHHKKPVKLASFAFKIPNKKVKAEKRGVYLYLYD